MARKYTLYDVGAEPKRRVSLTKKQLETEAGKTLLKLLVEITQDGDISVSEVQQLYALLNEVELDIPALNFLIHVTSFVKRN